MAWHSDVRETWIVVSFDVRLLFNGIILPEVSLGERFISRVENHCGAHATDSSIINLTELAREAMMHIFRVGDCRCSAAMLRREHSAAVKLDVEVCIRIRRIRRGGRFVALRA